MTTEVIQPPEKPMLAYHNDPAVKAKYMDRVIAHRAADELIQGTGFEDGKGCAVGCTFDDYDHSRGPVEIGVPEELMHLEDAIFEGLSESEAMDWPTRFLDAVPCGADLSMAWPRISLWLLTDEHHGVRQFAGTEHGVAESIDGVAALYREWCETGVKPAKYRFESAESAARSARSARSAAESAESAARSAAWSARSARSAARSAESAARSARSAAKAEFWTALAAKIEAVLRECPVIPEVNDEQ